MKTGWQTSSLGDVLATIKNGLNCKQDKSGVGQRISRIESISLASFDLSRVGYAEISGSDKSKFKLIKGDILFSHINSPIHVGKTAVFDADEDVYHGVNLLLMRPVAAVKSAYLEFFLKYLFDTGYWRKTCKQSVNQASVNQQDISRVPFSYPADPKEQQRIVAILDEAFDGIATAKANAEKNFRNARALFESHLQSVFNGQGVGWKVIAFEDAVDDACTLSYGIVQPGDEYLGGVPVVRPTDLGPKIIEIEGLKRIDPGLSNSYHRTTLRGGDLLLCVRGATGQISIASSTLTGANVTRGIVPIFFERSVVSQELGYYLMRSDAVQSQIREKTYGTALQQINIGDLRKLKLPIPPKTEQRVFTKKFDELSDATQRLESIYQQKLAALDELKKSLLHQAFSGAL